MLQYDRESIVIKVLANSSGDLIIPTHGPSTTETSDCPYSWKISIDGGADVTFSGTGGTDLTIGTSLTPDSEHLVKIEPTVADYQRARAFGTFGAGNTAQYITEIVQDSSYMGYAVSATNTGDYFREYQYEGCVNLTTPAEEYMPDTVTTIGNHYMRGTYYGCSSITTTAKEVMPDSVTSIGDRFRQAQYQGCTNLTVCLDEVFSDNVTTVGTYFRGNQYYECKALTQPANEAFSNSAISIGDRFRNQQYRGCIALTKAAKEEFGNSVTTIGTYFRNSQYLSCTSLVIAADEVFSDSVTTIGTYFRASQYYETGITKTGKEAMSENITNIGNYFRRLQYYGCISLTEVVGECYINSNATLGTNARYQQYCACTSLIKARLYAFNGGTSYRYMCFNSVVGPLIVTILGDIVDNAAGDLSNSNVDKIYVDSNLVASYQSSATWSGVDDDKFVAIPSETFSVGMLLSGRYYADTFNAIDGVQKIINREYYLLDGTETYTEDTDYFMTPASGLGSDVISNYNFKINGSYFISASSSDNVIKFRKTGLPGYSLQDFTDWITQNYSDGVPVFVVGNSTYRQTQLTPIDINTRNGENVIEIVNGGPTDLNKLEISMVVDVASGGYTANVFNGEDYTDETDWTEISDTQLIAGDNITIDGKVISATNTTYGAGAGINIDDNNDIQNTGVLSVNSSTGAVTVQETLVSGTNIKTINSTSLLGNGDISISEFTPSNAGSVSEVLTKTAGGYERGPAPATGIQNDTIGTTTTVTKIRAGTEAEYNSLGSYSASTIYHIY